MSPAEKPTQADREAAAKVFDRAARKTRSTDVADLNRHYAKRIRAGEGDDFDAVQAATISRLAADQAVRTTTTEGGSFEVLRTLSDKAKSGPWGIQAYYTNPGTPEEIVRGQIVDDDDYGFGIVDEEVSYDAESLSPNLDFAVAAVNYVRAALASPRLTTPAVASAEVREALADKQLRQMLAAEFEDQGVTGYARHILSGRCDWEWVSPVLTAMRLAHAGAALPPTETPDGPKVHHMGVSLQQIADTHADVLNPREIRALYMAARKLWDVRSDDDAPDEAGRAGVDHG